MSSTDAHQGGRLEHMAKKGTTVPRGTGSPTLIPSVPRPDQVDDDDDAADNPIDIATRA
ncbi:MAG: hypothetical protein M1816_001906 [Peltula sp. TS41687]|nr:MAG: hypothetical protein M1816_001906 [Peltula sp. TS41687]